MQVGNLERFLGMGKWVLRGFACQVLGSLISLWLGVQGFGFQEKSGYWIMFRVWGLGVSSLVFKLWPCSVWLQV